MNQPQVSSQPHQEVSLYHGLRVAICGNLPTAHEHLLRQGVVQIDHYEDAAEIFDEASYHLILIYAPNAEGILDTVFSSRDTTVPIRLLNEPACQSALLELNVVLRQISERIDNKGVIADV